MIQAFIQTLKIFLYRLTVFQRPVLEFAVLSHERPIKTAMLNMEGTVRVGAPADLAAV